MLNILARLNPDTVLVTANLRLSRHLRLAYDRQQVAQGASVWESPLIMPWSAWLLRCWESLQTQAIFDSTIKSVMVLSTDQELVLWEQVIRKSRQGEVLLHPAATARHARDAWHLLHGWQMSLSHDELAFDVDALAFADWSKGFVERCSQQGWLDSARLPALIGEYIKAGKLRLPPSLLLAGFDEITPQQQGLLDSIRDVGVDVEQVEPLRIGGQAVRVALPDARAEALAAAHWVRGLLDQAQQQVSIGIVVPGLETQRPVIMRALDDVLSPSALLPGQTETKRPYNLSLGRPLLDYAIIASAFTALELAQGKLGLSEVGVLLRSSFLAGADEELSQRCLLDARLREAGELSVSIRTLLFYSNGLDEDGVSLPHACPILHECLERWHSEVRALPRRQLPSAWSEVFSRLLNILGWPGPEALSSHDYQTVQAWHQLLVNFSSLDNVMSQMSLSDAISQLRRLAAATIFQPQSPDVPVQVLGVLEATGMQFDHLWIMGLHDELWPASPHPTPFLPVYLQRRYGLPHASAERELQFAQGMTERLLASAPDVVISYPCRDGERELRPSPLIIELPQVDHASLYEEPRPTYRDMIHSSGVLEVLQDDRAPALTDSRVRGGTAVFKYQAACPFRAFAELRLGARPLDEARVGLDALERGSLLHAVMEKLWTQLQSQQQLCALAEDALNALINDAVTEAIDESARLRPQTFTNIFTELERSRLLQLVREWLEYEKARAPFSVLATEQKQSISAGGIEVNAKIDRIDQLADGRQIMIDYKTGKVDAKQWFGERPDEPQLPLYSLVADSSLAAVLFAQLKKGEMAYMGIAAEDGLVDGIDAFKTTRFAEQHGTWSQLLQDWRETLTQLGEEFREGQAAVAPKDYPRTCQYCSLTPLCRINEHTVLDSDLPEEGYDHG